MAVLRQLELGPKTVLRTVLVVLTVIFTVYVVYLLRRPISWLIIAAFLAIAVSGPVNLLHRYMKRGLAIALVYMSLILIPLALGAILIPPLVNQGQELLTNIPEYTQDFEDFVNENETLAKLNEDYNITGTLQEQAEKLPSQIGNATDTLSDIGVGLVNSIFATVTILILSIFMVGGGRAWVEQFLNRQDPRHRERMRRTFERIANAIGNYVGGAMLQATIAGTCSFVALRLLGAPFAGPLALIVAFFDLIPVVGATIAAFLVAVVMIFVNFPWGVIIWIVFAITYQQVENYLIQPQIQRRAVEIEPFLIIVAVLFGSTLFGVLGAVLAIPFAASIQIAVREFADYRRGELLGEPLDDEPPEPPSAPAPAT